MIGYIVLAAFLVVWIAIAIAYRKEKKSMTIAVGGGFLCTVALLLCLAGIVGGVEKIIGSVGSLTNLQSDTPPADAFDPSTPENQRIEEVRKFIVGEWSEPLMVEDFGGTYTNYTFGPDGSLKIWQCARWGEQSERSYKPYDDDGHAKTYTIEATRYANTGKIHYQVIRGDGMWGYPILVIDRDQGFFAYMPSIESRKPMEHGHRTDCS